MTPAYRQYLLKKKETTQKQIAQDLGVAEMCVSNEIHDRPTSDRIRRAIAAAIGRPVDKVFPNYYNRGPMRRTSKAA